MARIEQAVKTILLASTDITGLVSTKVYPEELPQNCVLPAITYTRISTIRHSAMTNDPGIAETRIQISAYSSVFATMQNIAEKIRITLMRYTGTVSSVTILDSWPENETQIYYPDLYEYQMALDFMITHTESSS